MEFIRQLGLAAILVAGTLLLQSAGMALLIHWARSFIARGIRGLGPWMSVVLMIRFTTAMVVLHILQILLWAGSYRWLFLPSSESAFYFSATSYSTVGYGDIVLPKVWRILGPMESVMGVLMCGISVSALFAIATRLVEAGDPVLGESQNSTSSVSVSAPEFQNSDKITMPLRTNS
jgi:voltage-gated potassium channel